MPIRTFIQGLGLSLLLMGLSLSTAGAQTEQNAPNKQADIGLDGEPGSSGNILEENTAVAAGVLETTEVEKDVILVLDNSGSMKKNDPQFLTNQAVTEFVGRLDETTRVAIVIFDQDVHLVTPLTSASLANREVILNSLESINYKGLFTDSPAAIERAIYELKNNAGEKAQKFIIFMTDGIVDTGSAEKDVEKAKWLREDLAPDAADSNIRIFGIAFTEAADFQLIQSLAQKTDGEYFRVLRAEDLHGVFDRIYTMMQQSPEPEAEMVTEPESQVAQQPMTPVKQLPPVIVEIPAEPQRTMKQEERTRNLIIIISSAILILALITIIVLLVRRGRELRADEEMPASEAYLNDIHGYTNQASYKLGTKPTMLGRVAGKDTEHLDYVVIPESTIGRRHALIEYKDFAYWIVDQGSINGTFVNDVPINSEVRLKHGDKIRLHKIEFDFVMPEMNEAGMTVISNTVFAQQGITPPDEATVLKGEGANGNEEPEMDFDLGISEEELEGKSTGLPDMDEEEVTAIRGDGNIPEAESAFDSEDETLIPGEQEIEKPDHGPDISSEDETLLPGGFDDSDEDATLRPDMEDKSLDQYIDELDTDKDKKQD